MKITKYFLSMAAAVGMIAACQKTEMVQIAAPENVVAPVLEAVEGAIEITPSNLGLEKAAFTWSLADFGVKTQVNYSLEAATAANSDAKVVIVSGITANAEALEAGSLTFEVEYEKLNAILFNDLKLNDGIAENVLFTVGAKVGEYAPVYSNAITVSCKVTAAEKQYPKLYVVGSYNGWSHDKNQYLFDFAGTDVVYQGMVDFGADGVDHSSNEFKITGGGWGNDEHSMNGAHDAESKTIALVAGGGDNINVYQAKRFYHLTFDRALTLTADFSFDQLGVIGSFNGWAEDVVMEFNTSKQRFYADVQFAEDGQFKFRADADWAVNWGADAFGMTVSNGDGNLEAKAGNYRVYVNMNDKDGMTLELNAGMYGKEEPTAGTTTPENPEPEPTPVVGWSLIGAFNEWGGDLMLASDGTYFYVKGAELEGELKFRKDGDWAVNFGLAEGAEFAANAEIAVAGNGANINVPAGTYDVYLDEANAKAWFITDGSYPGGEEAPEASEWGIVGVVNSWGGSPDVVMFKTATEGLFVAKNVAMPDGGFKIRANNEWNDAANYGLEAAGAVEVDHAYDLVCSGGSGDMTLVAGTYDIWFDLTNSKVYIMTPGKPISEAVGGEVVTPEPEPEPDPTELTWYLVGNFNGWTVADAAYTMTKEAEWFVFKGFVADGDGFKFNAGSWDINRGATGDVEPFELAANTEYEIVANGKNFSIAAGTYDVYMSLDAAKVYVMAEGLTPGQTPEEPEQPEFEAVASEWGVVGVVNGWGSSADIVMYTTPTEGLFVAKNAEMPDGAFKIRANNEWNDAKNYGFAAAGTAAVDHAYDLICGGGSKDINLVTGTYDIYFDLNNSKVYVMTPGKAITEAEGGVVETPDASNWYLVGNFNGWATGDTNYKFSKEGNWYVFKGFTADGQGVKFNAGSWDDNRGGTFSAANTAIAISHNGADMLVTAGTYDVYMNAATDKAYFMTPGTTPAN